MKHINLIALFIIFGLPLKSQIFKLDFFDAERQGQVDSFIINYPQVTRIVQKLTIRKNVTNLSGLSNLTEIGFFHIKDNSMLKNFLGLEKLETCNLLLLEKNQHNIVDFTGLTNLKKCRSLGTNGSQTLQSLNGLESLKKIENDIGFVNCPRLKSIKALSNVDTIMNDFYDNGGGGSGIFEKYSQIIINNCDSLESLSGLENVTAFTYLSIQNNDRLTDISAIANANFLKYPERQSLYITGNKKLSICNYPIFCDYIQTVPRKVVLQVGQDKIYNINIFDNVDGCKDYQTLLDVCLVPTEEQQILNNAEIYPNPGSHLIEVNLESDFPLDIDVFDSQGRAVASEQTSNSIDTEHLQNGFYYIRLKHKESNSTTIKKWIKI